MFKQNKQIRLIFRCCDLMFPFYLLRQKIHEFQHFPYSHNIRKVRCGTQTISTKRVEIRLVGIHELCVTSALKYSTFLHSQFIMAHASIY